MSSIKSALKRARKIVKAKEAEAGDNSNKCIVVDEYDQEPDGALIIVLASLVGKDLDVPTNEDHVEIALA